MNEFGNILVVKTKHGDWKVRKLIPEGMRSAKWGVWRNGTHIRSETTKQRAVAVIEYWPKDIPSRRVAV